MHLTLTVNTVTNEVASHARQTQALTPPQGEIKISIDCGPIHKTGVKPDTQLTSLLGRATALRSAQGAPAPLSVQVFFAAGFVVDDVWRGAAGGTLSGQTHAPVPIKPDQPLLLAEISVRPTGLRSRPKGCKGQKREAQKALAGNGAGTRGKDI